MNFPNLITLIRILLVPLLVIFLMEGKTDLALLTFIIAGASDAIDGFLARLLHQQTLFGAYIDPIADKLLINTSFITLAILGKLPGWLAVIIVSRDIIILAGIGILMINRSVRSDIAIDIKPSLISKTTTFVQLFTICFFLAENYVAGFMITKDILILLTSFITLISGFHYIARGFKNLGNTNNVEHSL